MADCCKANLVSLPMDPERPQVEIRVCKVCGRRHIKLFAGEGVRLPEKPLKLGIAWKLFWKSLKTKIFGW